MSFAGVLEDSLAAFAGLNLEPMVLPDGFATRERHKDRGDLRLDTQCFRVGDRGEVRTALVSSPKIAIANLFFFPEPDWNLPLHVLELVVLGLRPVVGVLDGLCLLPGMALAPPLADRWREAHTRHPLARSDDMPDWYRACRSGHDFFVRPAEGGTLAPLVLAHGELWRVLAGWIATASPLPSAQTGPHRAALDAYKHRHLVNFPGSALLGQAFGKDWTMRYLREVLFK